RVGYQTAPCTVATIGRTTVCYQKECAIGIAMHETLYRHRPLFSHRVQHLFGCNTHLLLSRDQLLADRAIGVLSINQVKEIRSDRQREFLIGKITPRLLLRSKGKVFFYLLNRRDTVLE